MLDMELEGSVDAPRPNYRVMDWDKFRKDLATRLMGLEVGENLQNESEFYSWLYRLMCDFREVVNEKVPKVKPSLFMK